MKVLYRYSKFTDEFGYDIKSTVMAWCRTIDKHYLNQFQSIFHIDLFKTQFIKHYFIKQSLRYDVVQNSELLYVHNTTTKSAWYLGYEYTNKQYIHSC